MKMDLAINLVDIRGKSDLPDTASLYMNKYGAPPNSCNTCNFAPEVLVGFQGIAYVACNFSGCKKTGLMAYGFSVPEDFVLNSRKRKLLLTFNRRHRYV